MELFQLGSVWNRDNRNGQNQFNKDVYNRVGNIPKSTEELYEQLKEQIEKIESNGTIFANKGVVYPMENVEGNGSQLLNDAILDVTIHYADTDEVYSINHISKDTTAWQSEPQSFFQIYKSVDGRTPTKAIIGRNQWEIQGIGNNPTGVRTHVLKRSGMTEIVTITIDWDAVPTGSHNFPVTTIISPSKYFFRTAFSHSAANRLEEQIAVNINGRYIDVKHELNEEKNIIYEFGSFAPNDFFEIRSVSTQKTNAMHNDFTGTTALTSSTDWVSPYRMLALENAVSDGTFTVGGGHGTDGGTGFPTGSFIGIYDIKMDGNVIANGNHIGNILTFRVEHYVSAPNAINLDTGAKRNSLKEVRYYSISKNGIDVEVEIEALEYVRFTGYAGLQTVQRDYFDYFYIPGDAPQKLYTVTGLSSWMYPTSTSAALDRVVMYNNNVVMIMQTDRSYGIGTGEYLPTNREDYWQRLIYMTPNVGKIYMHNLGRGSGNFRLQAGEKAKYRGSYVFTENKSETKNIVEYGFKGQSYADDLRSYEVVG